MEETLEHTGLGGAIEHKSNFKAHRQAKQWQKAVKSLRAQGGKFLKTHPSEDLETALKALEIAEGSLEQRCLSAMNEQAETAITEVARGQSQGSFLEVLGVRRD